jgi:hypothetical protein
MLWNGDAIASSQPEQALLTHFLGFGFADPGCEQINDTAGLHR